MTWITGAPRRAAWQLLWSLVVFNLGIEAVQVGVIVVAFPVWFVQRLGG